jgi:hypothetical protein
MKARPGEARIVREAPYRLHCRQSESVEAQSGGANFTFELDFESGRWSCAEARLESKVNAALRAYRLRAVSAIALPRGATAQDITIRESSKARKATVPEARSFRLAEKASAQFCAQGTPSYSAYYPL